jgi:hypothetical protein
MCVGSTSHIWDGQMGSHGKKEEEEEEEEEEAGGSTFVLDTITSICTYNVGADRNSWHYDIVQHSGIYEPCELIP